MSNKQLLNTYVGSCHLGHAQLVSGISGISGNSFTISAVTTYYYVPVGNAPDMILPTVTYLELDISFADMLILSKPPLIDKGLLKRRLLYHRITSPESMISLS